MTIMFLLQSTIPQKNDTCSGIFPENSDVKKIWLQYIELENEKVFWGSWGQNGNIWGSSLIPRNVGKSWNHEFPVFGKVNPAQTLQKSIQILSPTLLEYPKPSQTIKSDPKSWYWPKDQFLFVIFRMSVFPEVPIGIPDFFWKLDPVGMKKMVWPRSG